MVDAAAAPAADGAAPTAGAEPIKEEQSILDAAKPAPDKPADGTAAKPDAGKPAVDAAGKPVADGAKPVVDKPAAKAGEEKPQGAPEKYEPFTVPEGVTFDPKAVEAFQAKAKELGLSQDQAQKLVDFQSEAVKVAQDTNKKNFEDLQKEWSDQTKKDLGANADKELAFAAAGRDKFATEGLRSILNDSGLANHPEVIKMFITIGKAISEDGFVPGAAATDKADKSHADIMYPEQGK